MAAGHDQIRDARQRRHALPVPAGIPGPNLRALETALQPPDRMFDLGRRRSLALPLGPIRPAIARLLALAPLRRDLPDNLETFPLRADLLSVAALHGADVEAVGMPASPRILPTAAASVAASGCLRQPLSGPALRNPAATLPVSAPARPFRRDCLAALSAKAFPGGLSGRRQRDARHLAGSPFRLRCWKEELARVSELPARVSRFECLWGRRGACEGPSGGDRRRGRATRLRSHDLSGLSMPGMSRIRQNMRAEGRSPRKFSAPA